MLTTFSHHLLGTYPFVSFYPGAIILTNDTLAAQIGERPLSTKFSWSHLLHFVNRYSPYRTNRITMVTTDVRREIYVHIRAHLHDKVNATRVDPRWLMGGGFNSVSPPAPLARLGLGCRRSLDDSRGRHSTTSSIQHTTAFVIVGLHAWIMTSGVELGHGIGADREYDRVADGVTGRRWAEGRGRVVAGATWGRVKFIVGVDMG